MGKQIVLMSDAKKRKTMTKGEIVSLVKKSISAQSEAKYIGSEFYINRTQGGLTDPTNGMTLWKVQRGDTMYQRSGREITTTGIRVAYHLHGANVVSSQIKIAVIELTGGHTGSTLNTIAFIKKNMFESLNNATAVPSWGVGVGQHEKLTMPLNTSMFKVLDLKTFNMGHENGTTRDPASRVGYYTVPIKRKIVYSDNSTLNFEPDDNQMNKNIAIICWGGQTNPNVVNNAHGEFEALIQVKQYFTDA